MLKIKKVMIRVEINNLKNMFMYGNMMEINSSLINILRVDAELKL